MQSLPRIHISSLAITRQKHRKECSNLQQNFRLQDERSLLKLLRDLHKIQLSKYEIQEPGLENIRKESQVTIICEAPAICEALDCRPMLIFSFDAF